MVATPGGLRKASSAITSYRAQSPGTEGVGSRTHEFRCDNTDGPGLSNAAADFLLASRIARGDMEFNVSVGDYFVDPMIVTYGQMDRDTFAADVIELPRSSRVRAPLEQVIARRRSGRNYTGESLDLRDVAAFLRGAAGVTGHVDVPRSSGDIVRYNVRAVPSGGGLYPVSIFMSAQRVSGLSRGVYRYSPVIDRLVPVTGEEGCRGVRNSMAGEPAVEQSDAAGVHLVFVISPWRAMRKYGARGLRFALQEVGAIAQQINLVCTGLGLASVESSSFYEDELNQALNLDGIFQTATHTMTVGVQA